MTPMIATMTLGKPREENDKCLANWKERQYRFAHEIKLLSAVVTRGLNQPKDY